MASLPLQALAQHPFGSQPSNYSISCGVPLVCPLPNAWRTQLNRTHLLVATDIFGLLTANVAGDVVFLTPTSGQGTHSRLRRASNLALVQYSRLKIGDVDSRAERNSAFEPCHEQRSWTNRSAPWEQQTTRCKHVSYIKQLPSARSGGVQRDDIDEWVAPVTDSLGARNVRIHPEQKPSHLWVQNHACIPPSSEPQLHILCDVQPRALRPETAAKAAPVEKIGLLAREARETPCKAFKCMPESQEEAGLVLRVRLVVRKYE
ncbi:hypothetical protein K525DRAFT_252070 [Schizophyllum commune Loenen D]|nr:hypothetical protein K525DRAFT_252070 [Schizophyllum commune Loenen D]